jgi:hypothetical protein
MVSRWARCARNRSDRRSVDVVLGLGGPASIDPEMNSQRVLQRDLQLKSQSGIQICSWFPQNSTNLNRQGLQLTESIEAQMRVSTCLGRKGTGVQIAPPRPIALFAVSSFGRTSTPVAICGFLGFLEASGSYNFDCMRVGWTPPLRAFFSATPCR